jgi:nucleoside phosphorylase
VTGTVGFVLAMPEEARAFLGHRLPGEPGQPVWCLEGSGLACVSGTGRVGAAASARRLVQAGAGALVSLGVSGGLKTGLKPGDLVLGEWVVEAEREWRSDPDLVQAARQALARLDVAARSGRVLSVEQPVLASRDKAFLGASLGVMAVDLESGAVAAEAARAGLPFAAVRSVCDPVGLSLPREIPAILAAGPGGVSRAVAVARCLVARPALIGGLIRLGLDYRAALGSLGACRRAFVRLSAGLPAGARRERTGCPSA